MREFSECGVVFYRHQVSVCGVLIKDRGGRHVTRSPSYAVDPGAVGLCSPPLPVADVISALQFSRGLPPLSPDADVGFGLCSPPLTVTALISVLQFSRGFVTVHDCSRCL